jgi:hypothetical protein
VRAVAEGNVGLRSAIIVYVPIHTFNDDNAPGVRSRSVQIRAPFEIAAGW